MADAVALPATFAVPRDGELVRVTIGIPDELRVLRTELELLDRIDRQVRFLLAARREKSGNRYGTEDRRELARILEDAGRDEVRRAIAAIDQKFTDARKGIAMTVVNDEADKIVREALDSGAVDGTSPGEPADTETVLPDAVENALASAESELAQVAATDTSPDTAPIDPQPDGVDMPAEPDPIAEAIAGVEQPESTAVEPNTTAEANGGEYFEPGALDTSPVNETPGESHAAPDDEADAIAAMAAAIETVDGELSGAPAQATADAPTAAPEAVGPSDAKPEASQATAPSAPPANDGTPLEAPGPTGSTPAVAPATPPPSPAPRADTGYSPERAVAAVSEIENGIRMLSDLLGSEVNQQWTLARDAMEDIVKAQTEVHEVLEQARGVLSDISRVKAEAEVARAEADVARQEAKLIREDAGRAKERAETSAKAAELAADQAARDARAATAMPA